MVGPLTDAPPDTVVVPDPVVRPVKPEKPALNAVEPELEIVRA
jgi:hypothetical protein